jgi:anti-sigma factor RsiW
MTKTVNRHIGEETAEKYSLSKLAARKSAEVEEHLLTCEPCRQAVAASDAYVAAMRKAVAKMRKPGRKMAGN